MFEIYQEEAQRLTANIELLKKSLIEQKTELTAVKALNTQLEIILKEKELVTEDIEKKYKNLLNAREIRDGLNGTEEAKAKINTLVREINKCIALINN